MSGSTREGHRERLRQRFAAGQTSSQTDEALLELLLCYGIPRQDVRPLALELLRRFGSLDAVLSQEPDGLRQQSGLGEQSVVLLKLVDTIRKCGPAPSGTQDLLATRAWGQLQLMDDVPDAQSDTGGSPRVLDDPDGRDGGVSEAPVPDACGPPCVSDLPSGSGMGPTASHRTRSSQGGTGLFSKAVLKESIELVPRLPDGASLPELREFLVANLHYSSVQTRERHAGYILRRLFPDGEADHDFLRFARHYAGRQELGDVCFYRFCRAEALMVETMEQLVLPAVGGGRLVRERVASYLSGRFPNNRVVDCSQAIAQALGAADLARVTRTTLTFSYRDVLVPSFAFVVHSEFPEPGMYDLSLLQQNPRIRAMLWEPGRIVTAVYELRNRGLISKVSEIDNVRQFTTTLTPAQVVDRLLSDGGGHEVG